MRNAQIEIADIAGQVDSLRQAFEMQMAELRVRQAELAEQIKTVQQSVSALERKPAVHLGTAPVEVPKPVAAEGGGKAGSGRGHHRRNHAGHRGSGRGLSRQIGAGSFGAVRA